MKLSTLLVVLFIFQVQAGKPIQRENGIWYTGKGCGVTTEIKYLQEVPDDDSNLQCTFIPRKDLVYYDDLVNELFAAPTPTTTTTTTTTTATTTEFEIDEKCFWRDREFKPRSDGTSGGETINSYTTKDEYECVKECRKTEGCGAIVFGRGECFLKTEVVGGGGTLSRKSRYASVIDKSCFSKEK